MPDNAGNLDDMTANNALVSTKNANQRPEALIVFSKVEEIVND